MEELAGDPSGRVKVEPCAPRSDIPYLKIEGTGSDRTPVLIIAGMHARELAPPDALLNLAEVLIVAQRLGADVAYPSAEVSETAWNGTSLQAGTTVTFPEWIYPQAMIAEIAKSVDLYLLPLTNPDGRDKDLHDRNLSGAGWRWNLAGVDLNRNFDIAWQWETFYDTLTLKSKFTNEAQWPSDTAAGEENYRGSSAASELETQNVQNLIRNVKPKYFLDVHAYGRSIMYPWFIEHNGTDDSMRWSNRDWDGKRDGLPPEDALLAKLPPDRPDYTEFHPNGLLNWVKKRHEAVAADLRDAILESASALTKSSEPAAKARKTASEYTPYPGAMFLAGRQDGPSAGSSVDYAFSQYRPEVDSKVVFAFALEAGHESEAGFRPFYSARRTGGAPWETSSELQYPKIEREIHAACLALLQQAASGSSEAWPW